MGDQHTEYRQRITVNVDGSRVTTTVGSGSCTCDGSGGRDHFTLVETIDLTGADRD